MLPAGMTTSSAPVNAFSSPLSAGKYPDTLAGVSMWFKSVATPIECTISYNLSSVTIRDYGSMVSEASCEGNVEGNNWCNTLISGAN